VRVLNLVSGIRPMQSRQFTRSDDCVEPANATLAVYFEVHRKLRRYSRPSILLLYFNQHGRPAVQGSDFHVRHRARLFGQTRDEPYDSIAAADGVERRCDFSAAIRNADRVFSQQLLEACSIARLQTEKELFERLLRGRPPRGVGYRPLLVVFPHAPASPMKQDLRVSFSHTKSRCRFAG
jgi:hypothetical protein